MKCQFCNTEIKTLDDAGYLRWLDDAQQSRLKELRLQKGQNLCHACKKEIMFAGLITVL